MYKVKYILIFDFITHIYEKQNPSGKTIDGDTQISQYYSKAKLPSPSLWLWFNQVGVKNARKVVEDFIQDVR